jgi:hypothetical protein
MKESFISSTQASSRSLKTVWSVSVASSMILKLSLGNLINIAVSYCFVEGRKGEEGEWRRKAVMS